MGTSLLFSAIDVAACGILTVPRARWRAPWWRRVSHPYGAPSGAGLPGVRRAGDVVAAEPAGGPADHALVRGQGADRQPVGAGGAALDEVAHGGPGPVGRAGAGGVHDQLLQAGREAYANGHFGQGGEAAAVFRRTPRAGWSA
jgi:hypothetical protein